MTSKANSTVVNTLMISDSDNKGEQIASHLKNHGIPIRHKTVSNSEQLKESLDSRQWQQAILINELPNMPIGQTINLLKQSNSPVPSILLSEEYTEQLRFDSLAKGIKDCLSFNDLDLLAYIVKREQLLVEALSTSRLAQKLVLETSKRNELLLDSSKDAIAYIHEGMHIYTNPTYSERFGYDEDDIIVMTIMDMIAPESSDELKLLLKEQSLSGEEVSKVLKGRTDSGDVFEANFIVSSAIYDDEECVQLLVREVADQSELMQKLKEASQIDSITGAFNRPAFMEKFGDILTKSRESGSEAFLYFIEIDDFDSYRTEYGISACDDLLNNIANWMNAQTENRNTILGKISDSSFALVQTDTTDMPSVLPKELCANIKEELFEISNKTHDISFSIGAVTCVDNDMKANKLMIHATTVSHKIQNDGGNNYQVFNPSIDSLLTDDEKAIFDQFNEARQAGNMTLFYQPMMGLKGGTDEQYACYFRYKLADGTWGLPSNAFSIFEKLGIDADIDKITFTHTLKVLMKEHQQGNSTRLFLSINPNTLTRDGLTQWLKVSIEKSGINPNNLVLTIRSSLAQNYLKRIIELKEFLHATQIKLCLTHVTTEDAELIKSVSPDFVLLDGEVIDELQKEGSTKVTPLLNLAQQLQAKTVVTHLEDASTLAQVWPLGVDFAMGNYISQPLSKLSYDFSDSDF